MITCHTTSGSGNSDLYAKFGSQPTLSSYDALSNGGSTNEAVGPLNASTSDRTLYVMVYALTPIIDVELWCDLDYTTSKPTASSTTISPTSNLSSSTNAPTRLPTSNQTASPTNAPTRQPTSNPNQRSSPSSTRPTNSPTKSSPTSGQPTKSPTPTCQRELLPSSILNCPAGFSCLQNSDFGNEDQGGYNIDLSLEVNSTVDSAAYRSAYMEARCKWMEVIIGDLSSVSSSSFSADQGGGCTNGLPSSVDDLHICGKDAPDDGEGKRLGFAGPTYLRKDPTTQKVTSVAGYMR